MHLDRLVDPRERWQALQSHLQAARRALERGDRQEALDQVEQALRIDPQFLAAHSLRDRIRAGHSMPARVRPAAAPAVSSSTINRHAAPAPPVVSPPMAPTAEPVRAADVRAPEAQATPAISAEGWARFEQRARERRIRRRLDAARAAVARRRFDAARDAIAEVRAIDADYPELGTLATEVAAAEQAYRTRPRRSRWLAAAAAFGTIVLGATLLDESPALRSNGTVLVTSLVDSPAPDPITMAVPVVEPDLMASAEMAIGSPLPAAAAAAEPAPAAAAPPPPAAVVPPARTTVDRAPVRDATVPPPASVATAGVVPPRTAVPAPVTPPPSVVAERAPAPTPAASPAAAPSAAAPAAAPNSLAPPAPRQADIVTAEAARDADADVRRAVRPDDIAPAAVVAAGTPLPSPVVPAVDVRGAARPNDEELVRDILQRYRTAYETLDVTRARAVWPAVNESALARAFEGLQSQRLTFDDCNVELSGPAARAECHGSARYVPKVGSREPRVEPRVWNFTLRKSGEAWHIESARAAR